MRACHRIAPSGDAKTRMQEWPQTRPGAGVFGPVVSLQPRLSTDHDYGFQTDCLCLARPNFFGAPILFWVEEKLCSCAWLCSRNALPSNVTSSKRMIRCAFFFSSFGTLDALLSAGVVHSLTLRECDAPKNGLIPRRPMIRNLPRRQ